MSSPNRNSESGVHAVSPMVCGVSDGETLGDDLGDASLPKGLRKMIDPCLPSQAEIDAHNLTHLPYRNWCVHCLRGRGKALPHQKSTKERSLLEIHVDYCFPGDEDGSPTLKVLVCRERITSMTLAVVVDKKGGTTPTVERVVKFMKEVGCHHSEVIVKGDQENAIEILMLMFEDLRLKSHL